MVEARALVALSTLHQLTGATSEGIACAELARKLFHEMGSPRWVAIIDRLHDELRADPSSPPRRAGGTSSHPDTGW